MSKECPFCNNGTVELRIQAEVQDVITCPECNGTGYMTPTQHELSISGIMAYIKAYRDE